MMTEGFFKKDHNYAKKQIIDSTDCVTDSLNWEGSSAPHPAAPGKILSIAEKFFSWILEFETTLAVDSRFIDSTHSLYSGQCKA